MSSERAPEVNKRNAPPTTKPPKPSVPPRATPAPREDGWEELRREIEALPQVTDRRDWFSRAAVLAIVDRLAAARGEPPEPGPAIDVERLRKAIDLSGIGIAEGGHLASDWAEYIAAEYDRLTP